MQLSGVFAQAMEWYKSPSMSQHRRILPIVLILAPALAGCGMFKSGPTATEITERNARLPPEVVYNNGINALQKQDYQTAVNDFNDIEQNTPYSPWATNAQLMHGYAEYLRSHYSDAISALNRYIDLHPADRDIAYAYYLRALCYYEQISDVQREQATTQEAIDALQEVVNRFPNSAYARDAQLKIDLGEDQLAGHEMVIGKWYEKQHLYAAAIGRYQVVINNYQTTNHTAEALERLTELYLKLGLTDEARRTAAVLAYNYPGSKWYQEAYAKLASTDVINPKTGDVVTSDADTTADTGSVQQKPTVMPQPKSSGGFFGWLF
ncbi:MAG TPA: outer membrane protein assembly factor BamD [Acidisoma sp.]|jgi:outer membrane protein assembly factor BamD|uniref:outer membrane protein assembly factor BamD n=1 Tax=Acidisoma sp. TaxID=1872115 RepID=UPI002BE2BFB2|nr:outer membrane protein assembly factor BamD [Acidisoma sp.]HTI03200.1 outer membrane protein assembly factor BamD [Acidisoma sp.]